VDDGYKHPSHEKKMKFRINILGSKKWKYTMDCTYNNIGFCTVLKSFVCVIKICLGMLIFFFQF